MSFRQVDIDQYDPESVVNYKFDNIQNDVNIDDIQAASNEARAALATGDSLHALQTVLANPPYGCADAIKEKACDAVLQVLSAFRVSEISKAVSQLSRSEQSVLVKYLYKVSSLPQGRAQGTIVLNWMEKTFEIAGQPAIMRHITDRRTL